MIRFGARWMELEIERFRLKDSISKVEHTFDGFDYEKLRL